MDALPRDGIQNPKMKPNPKMRPIPKMRPFPLDPSTRHIITTSTRYCDNCGDSWPDQKLFHCNKCRTTTCLRCQCLSGGGFHSHVQDCMVFPGNCIVGPPTASRSETSQQPVISPRRGLTEPREEPFTNLQAQSWLHGRPEDDVYRLLIDSYRLHSFDKFHFEKANKLGTIFAGATDSANDFSSYLSAAAGRPLLLPRWWTRANHQDCVRMGLRHAQFHDLHVQLSHAMVVDYYRDASFPTQLRLFAEQVLGRPLIMRSCTPVLERLAFLEKEFGDTALFEWNKYNKAFAIQKWPGRF